MMAGSVREAIPVINASLATVFLDALAHAGGQLAELVERDIIFRGSNVAYVRLEELPLCHADGPETPVTAVYLAFSGGIDGHVVLSMTPEAAGRLSRILLMYDTDLDTPELLFLADSMVGELGNIIASAFLNAVANEAGLTVFPTPPCVVHDMWGAVLQSVVVEVAQEQSYGILVESSLIVDGDPLEGTLIVLPSLASCMRLEEVLSLRAGSRRGVAW
ncbi:MAG TPA: chemotaxis protein CheC [Chloroflexota bacterium]|jgi:chemotaxis protein CheC